MREKKRVCLYKRLRAGRESSWCGWGKGSIESLKEAGSREKFLETRAGNVIEEEKNLIGICWWGAKTGFIVSTAALFTVIDHQPNGTAPVSRHHRNFPLSTPWARALQETTCHYPDALGDASLQCSKDNCKTNEYSMRQSGVKGESFNPHV